MKNLIIFDVGGTLIKAKNIFEETAKKLGNLNLQEQIQTKFWEIIKQNPHLTEEQTLMLATEIIAEEKGLDATKIAGLMKDIFITKSTLKENAEETLNYLKKQNHDIIIASDSDHDLLTEELKKHKILHFFKEILTSNKAKAYKPSNKFAEELQRIINKIKPDKTYFVGDSEVDIKTAKKINATPIYINKNLKHKNAEHNIKNLKEIQKIITK